MVTVLLFTGVQTNIKISIFLSILLLTACTPGFQQATVEAITPTPTVSETEQSCPVTLSPAELFIPPDPYPATPPGDHFWYGDESLWTALPPDGIWDYLPHNPTGYTQKLLWWRVGYSWTEEPQPDLQVSGYRLDDPSISFSPSPATNAFAPDIQSAMLIGVDFPTTGCWKITGRYADAELSYVVQIKASDSPNPIATGTTLPASPAFTPDTDTPEPSIPGSPKFNPTRLSTAALETVITFNQSDASRGDGPFIEIPPNLWAIPIAELQPLRVYWHQNNLAVVLTETTTTEEGLYIGVPISSYTPENDETVELIRTNDNQLQFRKKR